MQKMCYKRAFSSVLFIALVSFTLGVSTYAEEVMNSESANANYKLRITGPEGFLYEETTQGTLPVADKFGPDGQYRYEITLLPIVSKELQSAMRQAREGMTLRL